MTGSSIGLAFRVSTFGESHGPALGAVIDGCPPGIPLEEADIQHDLNRRRPGRNKQVTARDEADLVEILSGTFEGVTTGTPIGLLIRNKDQRSQDYGKLRGIFRPGHADFSYQAKYGVRDHRGGGRASARETAMRVAAGAIARKVLKTQASICIRACVSCVGEIQAQDDSWDWEAVESNPYFFPDVNRLEELDSMLSGLRKEGDSIGACVTLECSGVPAGLGDPVFDKLDASLGGAMLSINAAKGVEVGEGFGAIVQRGSEARDAITEAGFASNKSGGILGGISTGQDILVRVAFKPTSSVRAPIATISEQGEAAEVSVRGRHDPCVALRAPPIVEAMAAIVLCDHLLRQRAQNSNWQSGAKSDGE